MLMIYLLKVDMPELLSLSGEEPLRVLNAIDKTRAKTSQTMEKNPKGRAACIGAGLLIQQAMRDYSGEKASDGCVREVLYDDLMGLPATDFKYRTGPQGKPYFADESLPFFNISHAGGYVALAVSDTEVGIDIQNKRNAREQDMADRFFSQRESEAVKKDRDIFYRLWSRKEALGKCTGEGVRPYIDTDVLDLSSSAFSQYEWLEETFGDGMYLCTCKQKNN